MMFFGPPLWRHTCGRVLDKAAGLFKVGLPSRPVSIILTSPSFHLRYLLDLYYSLPRYSVHCPGMNLYSRRSL